VLVTKALAEPGVEEDLGVDAETGHLPPADPTDAREAWCAHHVASRTVVTVDRQELDAVTPTVVEEGPALHPQTGIADRRGEIPRAFQNHAGTRSIAREIVNDDVEVLVLSRLSAQEGIDPPASRHPEANTLLLQEANRVQDILGIHAAPTPALDTFVRPCQ